MSLLWPEPVHVLLQPHQIVVSHWSRGLRQRVTRQQRIPCVNASAGWQVPMAMVREWLHEHTVRRDRVKIVLSNHFVRYVLMPWNAQLPNEQERCAYLRHCFTQAYGDLARQWDLRVQPPVPDEPALASAVDAELLESLRSCVRDAGLRLAGIHPYLMLCANRTRASLPSGDVWMVVIEHGRICLAWLQHGVWRVVRNGAAESGAPEQMRASLAIQLARESVLAGDVGHDWPVVLYWPEADAPVTLPGRRVIAVPDVYRSTAEGAK